MKRYFGLWIMLSLLTLVGCASHQYPHLDTDLTKETWMESVYVNPKLWFQGASPWFLAGAPNATEIALREASAASSITTLMVSVPNFTKIKADGDFELQLFGSNKNSVYVYGPDNNVRNVTVQMMGDTLVVHQIKPSPHMQQVIIRIGVCDLTSLVKTGCGIVEGFRIHSSELSIYSGSKGNIYLSGEINLREVVNTNTGSVYVFGVHSPCLDIRSTGQGCVNICGKAGIRSIEHHGAGDINIIGADSGGLTIIADGIGRISLQGTVNLYDLKAFGKINIFVNQVNSSKLTAYVGDHAIVGLTGRIGILNLTVSDYANFFGRYLCTDNAYVEALNGAHINFSAGNKIFTSAKQNSSIYIFGRPNMVSSFVSDNAVIVPLEAAERSSCNGIFPVQRMAPMRVIKRTHAVNVYHHPRHFKLKHIDTRHHVGEG